MFNLKTVIRLLLLACVLVGSAGAVHAIEVYVSPSGKSVASGTQNDPLADLEEALARVRASGHTGAVIHLFGGIYPLEGTITLGGAESGSSAHPLQIVAVPGHKPRFIGGELLDSAKFRPVAETDASYYRLPEAARSRVLVYQLQGIAREGASGLESRGFGNRRTGYVELFSGNDVLEIATWPDANVWKSEARLENGYFVGASGIASNSMKIGSRAPLERWAGKQGAWMHGYLSHDWADDHLPVAEVNLEERSISFADTPPFTLGENRPFRIYNLPEELSAPGEYWIDSTSGLLYVWPVKGFRTKPAFVSTLDGPLFRLESAANITFTGITFEATRAQLVQVKSSSRITFESCTFRHSGTEALILRGEDLLVSDCEFYNTGAAAIDLEGGDPATLRNGNIVIRGSYFKDTGRHYLANSAAVVLKGVGNVVRNNLMTRLPHMAIEFRGNNHLIEYNDIVGACYYSDDAGAIYAGRDWSGWGTVIRRNLIREIRSRRSGANWVAGIYLDDCASGTEIYENVIYGIEAVGLNLGGGRNNLMQHNIIAATGYAAHLNDNRGLRWVTNKVDDSWNLLSHLQSAKVWSDAWAMAFPDIAETPDNWDELQDSTWLTPQDSVFAHNVGWANKRFAHEKDWVGRPEWVFGVYREFGENKSDHRPIFNSSKLRSRTTRPTIRITEIDGFPELDLSEVGPRVEYSADALGFVAFTAGTFLGGLEVMAEQDPVVDLPTGTLGNGSGAEASEESPEAPGKATSPVGVRAPSADAF